MLHSCVPRVACRSIRLVAHYKYLFLRFHCFGCRWYLLEHDAGRVRNSCPIMAPGKTYVERFFPTFWIKSEPIIHIESCLTSLLTMARDLHRDEDSSRKCFIYGYPYIYKSIPIYRGALYIQVALYIGVSFYIRVSLYIGASRYIGNPYI